TKETGAQIEIFCLEPEEPRDYAMNFQSRGQCRWTCLVGNLKRWKEG
ncbi:MAG TPA: S-adenosylmethionine tRNA ribosyltransferase, partial [Porphyromonadaceae bacterium]|nr:S-adenosylmethionine tRNA ribosyltransferase [Porphyromonadaceae bacterium]